MAKRNPVRPRARPVKTKRPVGRPKLDIDPKAVEDLAAVGKTDEGIAVVLGCSSDTLTRNFAEALRKGKNRRNSRCQEVQFNIMDTGNVTMAIWLGKQWLGQSDKTEVETKDTTDFRVAGRTMQGIVGDLHGVAQSGADSEVDSKPNVPADV